MKYRLLFGAHRVSIEDIIAVAHRECTVGLSDDPAFTEKIARTSREIGKRLSEDGVVYGVTTGYGDSCTTPVPEKLIPELPIHLTRFHGCGMGRTLSAVETRSVMGVRLSSLVQGWSAVSIELLQLLADMITEDLLPIIPAEGSVGASGDLTPLSYLAGAMAGERDVLFKGVEFPAAEALSKAGLSPITLRPKEALAIMNGTAVMTGLGALAFWRARSLSRLATRLSAMAGLALGANPAHFAVRLFKAKPFPGQARVAQRMREDLSRYAEDHNSARIQDRYSIRCAPHVIGVLEDMLPTFRVLLETEINSANDNPLVDPDDGEIYHGGHFYGGHVAFVMDSLKNLVANIADLLDRQMALMVDENYNNGLPANLSGSGPERAAINHGLKALQIAMSAWTAEALKLTMPASVFSRSTECHNQDKVSMGTIAARDAIRVLDLTEQVAAAHCIGVVQAISIRQRQGAITESLLTPEVATFVKTLRTLVPFIEEDLPLDRTLRNVASAISDGGLEASWQG